MIGSKPLICGEMHYPRIVRPYWRARLQTAYAMGLDAVSTYVFWNVHEPRPQSFDFSGQNDVAEFVRLAGACGLDVVLRPGPYVCAEWDFGGLPAWLLEVPSPRIRTADDAYMQPVRAWLRRLGEELAPLLRPAGGPIVAVQLENEYGAYGDDDTYLRSLRAALDDAGFGTVPYYTVDQPQDLARGRLSGVPVAATFGPGDPERDLAFVRKLEAQAALVCGEYWDGWFDRWGEPHQHRDEEQQVRDLQWMIDNGCSVNLYMTCGGTNFGFYNGANANDRVLYAPVTTSYDYLAPIDEAGRPTSKYFAFRNVIATSRGMAPRQVPQPPEVVAALECALEESAPLSALLGPPIESPELLPMELCGQSFGYILYRTVLSRTGAGSLEIDEVRDYATVLLDDELIGHLDRRLGQSVLEIDVQRAGARLDILVENCGRVNYGPLVEGERKGITRAVRWNGRELLDWKIFPLPLDDLEALRFSRKPQAAPAFHRGNLVLNQPGDTFVDVRELGKGVLFVNGRNAGRYWRIGPQRALYVPGTWLREGPNDIVAFDVTPLDRPAVRGLTSAVG